MSADGTTGSAPLQLVAGVGVDLQSNEQGSISSFLKRLRREEQNEIKM